MSSTSGFLLTVCSPTLEQLREMLAAGFAKPKFM